MSHHEVANNGQALNVNVTDEGIILDAIDNDGEVIGTVGMTFDEWYDFVIQRDPLSNDEETTDVYRKLP